MVEPKKLRNYESADNYENQLFPVYNNEETKPTKIRWLILMLSFFGVMCAYITRLNLSLTIVAMVRPANSSFNNSIITDASIKQEELKSHAPRFDWDSRTQGLILGSFFWTYGLLQVIGARYSEQFGSKLISLAIIFLSGIISFLIPFTAKLGVFPMLLSRALLGIVQSSVYPVYYCLISKWFPEQEQSRALALLSNGAFVGTIITMEFAGFLCESELGWPAVFYFSGAFCIVWSVFWIWLAASEPRLHSSVNKQEILYIEKEKSDLSIKHKHSTPWREILTNKAVWAVIIAKFGVDYTFWLLMLNLPQYINNILHFKIHANGLVNCSLNVVAIISGTIGGFLSDEFVKRKVMNKTRLRKAFQTFAVLGTSLCLILITYVQEISPKLVVSFLLLTMFFFGFNIGGDVPIVLEMTDDFPATLFALANGVCSLCGFLAPLVTGLLVNKNLNDPHTWSKVFYLAAAINTTGLLVFLWGASSEPLFKDKLKRNQTIDLDMINEEKEDSLLLSKKKKLFDSDYNLNNNHQKFNSFNLAFKDDDDY